jgi:hypothetical protein
MKRHRFPRAVPVLLAGALVLAAAGGCGASEETEPVTKKSQQPIPTARLGPPADPRKETRNLERGTTGWVGGLRLGIARASDGVGTVVVLQGRDVPADGNWQVTGKAGHGRRLQNDYTVTIDRVVDAKPMAEGRVGSGGGSVTVTVTPPAG